MGEDSDINKWLEHSTRASGVPLKIEDPGVIAQVAQLIKAQQPEE
ncbi:hypothetical protein ABZX65_29205 [Streptomyces sp. NPDC003300]